MAAPQVQAIQDIIAQLQAAQAPELKQIDESVAQNEASGAGQVAGLDAAKTKAFGNIEQAASNKGMFFSGFSPNAQAGYTGSTYLPALAKLQTTIANTRNTLMGQKAGLATQANTQAINLHEGQVRELNSFNAAEAARVAAAAEAEKNRQFQAGQNAQNRAASASRAAAASAPPPLNTGLTQLFSGYVPAKNGGTPFYTEQQIIPQVMNAYGLSQADAAKKVYDYRKQYFGE